jgi:hypothetical protein
MENKKDWQSLGIEKPFRTLEVPLDVDDDSKIAIIHVKKPNKTTRDIASKLAMKDSDGAIKATLKALYLGGDSLDTVFNSDDAMASLDSAVYQLLAVQQTVLKKN